MSLPNSGELGGDSVTQAQFKEKIEALRDEVVPAKILENIQGVAGGEYALKTYVDTKPTGFKNYIINGGFDVWQRGEVAIDGNHIYASADRWRQVSCTLDKGYDVNGNPHAKCTCVDDGVTNVIYTRIENQRRFAGKTLTLSFEMDSQDGITTGGLKIDVIEDDDTFNRIVDTTFSYNSTRKTFTFTFTVPDVLLKDNHYINIAIYGDSTLTNQNGKVFNVYNVQLEEGLVTTPFEQRPYGLELSLCQRYYEVGYIYSNSGYGETDTYLAVPIEFKVSKRTTPSITLTEDYQLNTKNVSIAGNMHSFRHQYQVETTGGCIWQGTYIADAEL